MTALSTLRRWLAPFYLGASPCGATKAAYRALADALVIRAPSHRVPTEAGIALAAGWKS